MEMGSGLLMEQKQALSAGQVQSLNILALNNQELEDFLMNEYLENPMLENSGDKENEMFTDMEKMYEKGTSFRDQYLENPEEEERSRNDVRARTENSLKEYLLNQLDQGSFSQREWETAEYLIDCLDEKGYFLYQTEELAQNSGYEQMELDQCLAVLKELEPVGIFASSLEECLVLQVLGMEQEAALCTIIRNHLQDVADGKVSTISRRLKLSSVEVRKLIHVIRNLNPRPLNGYGGDRAQYVFPDIILNYQDGQWTVSLNDKWAGNISINEFYVHMMETAQDEELKNYFEEKLKRARFIMNAVEQRRRTLEGITEGILKRQAGYFLGKEPLKPMTLEEIAAEREIHKSTVSRAIRDKYILTPAGCLLIRDLFTTGISGGGKTGEDVSRNTVKSRLKALVDQEDKKHPCSDEQLAKLLEAEGMAISRRTVAKYRMELGIGGAFSRREE